MKKEKKVNHISYLILFVEMTIYSPIKLLQFIHYLAPPPQHLSLFATNVNYYKLSSEGRSITVQY